MLNDFMPRFKPYDYRQDWMVSIRFAAQLPEGSLEYAFHHLIEERVSEEWFEALYRNDEIGRPAYSPKLLLKVILLPYARGHTRPRREHKGTEARLGGRGSVARIARGHGGGWGGGGGREPEMRTYRGAIMSTLKHGGVRARNEGAHAGNHREDGDDPFRFPPYDATLRG